MESETTLCPNCRQPCKVESLCDLQIAEGDTTFVLARICRPCATAIGEGISHQASANIAADPYAEPAVVPQHDHPDLVARFVELETAVATRLDELRQALADIIADRKYMRTELSKLRGTVSTCTADLDLLRTANARLTDRLDALEVHYQQPDPDSTPA